MTLTPEQTEDGMTRDEALEVARRVELASYLNEPSAGAAVIQQAFTEWDVLQALADWMKAQDYHHGEMVLDRQGGFEFTGRSHEGFQALAAKGDSRG